MNSEERLWFRFHSPATASNSFYFHQPTSTFLASPSSSSSSSNFAKKHTRSSTPNPYSPVPLCRRKKSNSRLSFFNRSSWHSCASDADSQFDRFSIYSSCPSISSSVSDDIAPPAPPPRKAESFLCVSNHLYNRAISAQRSYYEYLDFVLNRQRNVHVTMTQEAGPTINMISSSDEQESFQATDISEDMTTPCNELSTPSYTPPPPIDSVVVSPIGEHVENSIKKKPPMFIYSYDPPSPENESEYDPPPFFSPTLTGYSPINDGITATPWKENDKLLPPEKSKQSAIRPDSELSSSTLSASLLLTQDSDVSPLPPHIDRMSPLETDTMTSWSPNSQMITTSDPGATYTCSSPACSIYSDMLSVAPDLTSISIRDFDTSCYSEISRKRVSSTDELDAKDSRTPDTICVSPMYSERNTQSHSKNSEEPSFPTQSLSDSLKKSTEGTNPSSDRARRSSPPSSPDPSLSSLPSDTITMNTAIDSIGTDTDMNDNSSLGRNHKSESVHSQDETDQTIDSAFGSPSISPSCTFSSSITPVLSRENKSVSAERRTAKDSDEGFDKETIVMPSSDETFASDETSSVKGSHERSVDCSSQIDYADETENESIYPESECDIRLVSRAETDVLDLVQRDSSPERHSTPIIAELCALEDELSENLDAPSACKASPIVRNLSASSVKETSSSGNSSMSNSPALSAEANLPASRRNYSFDPREDGQPYANSHLTNWLRETRQPNYASNDQDTRTDADDVEGGIIIEEVSGDTANYSIYNGSRSFPLLGPLPTIHEVADTPTDTPVSDAVPILPLDDVATISHRENSYTRSQIIPSFHSDSPQAGSSSASFGTSTTSVGAPLPPPRIMHTFQKTPPVPPPPSDDEEFNAIPLPPLPSEEACLPPLPPLPATYYDSDPPPVPAHSMIPTPPQRMYLLIPLAPGLRTPQRMLSPPPAPPRSTSLRRSPPPPPPKVIPFTQVVDARHSDQVSSSPFTSSEDVNDDDRTVSSPSDVGSVICVSSKMTPLPEEKSPSTSPCPPALLIASTENMSRSETTIHLSNTRVNDIPTNPSNISTSSSPHILSPRLLSPPAPPSRQRKSLTPPLPPPPVKISIANDMSTNNKAIQGKSPDRASASSESCSSHGGDPKPAPPPPPPKPTFFGKGATSPNIRQASSRDSPGAASSSLSSLMSMSSYGKLVVDRSDISLPPPEEEVGRVFASATRWGFLADGVDSVVMYTQIRPIIQHGPQCGLVALSMASQLSGGSGLSTRRPSVSSTPTTPGASPSVTSGTTNISAADLLETARSEGFSTHGEMFSAESLAQLANMKLSDTMEASVQRDVLRDKFVFLELILAGALLLVPYDAQHNHQPGKYRGHKAHWGVVSGALVQSRKFSSGTTSAAAFARPDSRIDHLWHVRRGFHCSSRSSSRPSSRASSRSGIDDPADETKVKDRRERSTSPPGKRLDGDHRGRSMTPSRSIGGLNSAALAAFLAVPPEDLTVVALWRQGKSRTLVSSTLEELNASNEQLTEYPRSESEGLEKDFVIGNVEEGLAGQVVVLNKTTQPLTALSELLDRLQK